MPAWQLSGSLQAFGNTIKANKTLAEHDSASVLLLEGAGWGYLKVSASNRQLATI